MTETKTVAHGNVTVKGDTVSMSWATWQWLCDEDARLRASNAEILEALRAFVDCYGVGYKTPESFVAGVHRYILDAQEIIAKAEASRVA